MLLFENRVEDFMMARRGNFDFLPHLHHNLEILVCTEGAFGVSCCGKSAVLHRGDLMIAFSNQVHAYQDIGPARGIMMIVNPRMFPLLSGKLESRSYDNFLTEQGEFYISLAEAACREYEGGGAAEILTGYLYVLLGSALRSLPSQTQKTVLAADTFSEVLAYLSQSFTEPLSLQGLARQFAVDPCHLSRMFKQRTGYGYLEYLHLLRVTYARERLRDSGGKMTEIAMECGFSDQKTFNRVFKSLTGTTPSAYRAAARNGSPGTEKTV